MSRWLILSGLLLVVIGVAWPWLAKLGLFKLPGDIAVERENYRFYFPITTMVIISVVISLVLWLFRR